MFYPFYSFSLNQSLFGRFVTTFMSLIPLTRGKLREDELSQLHSLINRSSSLESESQQPVMIVMFPEGTRSHDGRLKSFKTGVSYLSARLNLPVVPIYIHGTNKALPKGKTFPLRREEFVVHFGKPITPTQFSNTNEDDNNIKDDNVRNRHDDGNYGKDGNGSISSSVHLSKENLQLFTDTIRSAVEALKEQTDACVQDRQHHAVNFCPTSLPNNARHPTKTWSIPLLIFHCITVLLRNIEASIYHVTNTLKKI